MEGDRHWLFLAIYGVIMDVLAGAPALGEVSVACRPLAEAVETTVTLEGAADRAEDAPWPPKTLFPLTDDDPRKVRMPFSDMAVSRGIIHIHRGELRRAETEEGERLTVTLPA